MDSHPIFMLIVIKTSMDEKDEGNREVPWQIIVFFYGFSHLNLNK